MLNLTEAYFPIHNTLSIIGNQKLILCAASFVLVIKKQILMYGRHIKQTINCLYSTGYSVTNVCTTKAEDTISTEYY